VLLRRWAALMVAAGVVALAVALFWTPLLGVGSVDVTGTVALTGDQVRTAANVTDGTPMLRLDTSTIASRVRTLPRVASVDVSRQWPNTVRIDITERTPIGVVTAPGGVRLVDVTGFAYATVAKAPTGLPVIYLSTVLPNDARTQAVVKVLASLPAQLRPQVTAITAQTPGGVQFALANGRTVIWGDADNAARKGAVLAALLSQQGKVYDVSAPDLPTIS
jgi:cell division protein FtsQ